MRWGQGTRLVSAIVLVGLAAGLAAAAGAEVRATYGAQTTADEPQYLLTALSLAEDASLDISDELAAERWRAFHEADLPRQTEPWPSGREVSPHDPLLPAVLAVPMALGGWVGAKWALAVLAGALSGLLIWVATSRYGVPLPAAAGVTAVFGLSAPFAVYGTQVYPELPAALAVTVAIACLTGSLRPAGTVGLAAAVVALPWLATKYAPVAAVLAMIGLARLWRGGDRARAVAFAGALTVAGAAFLAAHQLWYGGMTPYASGDHFVGGELTVVGTQVNLLGRSSRLLGLLVGSTFGLAAWQPAWLAVVPAFAAVARRRPDGWVSLAGPLAAGWLTATFVALTMQGWWWPGRQVVVVLPCAVLAIAWWAGRTRARFAAVLVCGAVGILTYAWLLADGLAQRITWVVDFFETTNPAYQAWRQVLPDYLDLTARSWVLHGLWLIVLAGAAWTSWRRAGAGRRGLWSSSASAEDQAVGAATASSLPAGKTARR